jgi:hypothetical protein
MAMRIPFKPFAVRLALAGSLTFIGAAAAEDRAAEKQTPPAAKSSLDEELLKSLDSKPRVGLDDDSASHAKPAPSLTTKPAERTAEKPSAPPAKAPRPLNPLDEELLKSLGGEDLGSAGEDLGQNRLTQIVREMRSVEERLAQGNSDPSTQRQQKQIAAELTALTEQLRKQFSQCQGGSKPSSGKPGSKPGRPNQTAGKSPATDPAKQPARDSTKEVRPNRSDRPDPFVTNELMKKLLDGLNLPEKDREQMLQAAPDDFLPNFEFSIKKYFERIVEEEAEK